MDKQHCRHGQESEVKALQHIETDKVISHPNKADQYVPSISDVCP